MTDDVVSLTREQVLRYRWRANGLDAEAGSVPVDDPATLDLGVQDGLNRAGVIGLVNRGVTPEAAIAATSGFSSELALAWTVRGAPHYVRRADLADMQVAISPFSERDAFKRMLAAGKDLAAADTGAIEGMRVLATAMRDAMPRASRSSDASSSADTLVKGELSAILHEVLPRAYQVDCRPCGATHPHEQLFRLTALHAGLEHEPGTNPPRLRRARDWPRRKPGPAADPRRAPERVQVIRAYLRLLGPATPRDVATYLETNVGEVSPHWPDDVRDVKIGATTASVLTADLEALEAAAEPPRAADEQVRLVSGFDAVLAAKDRSLVVPERERQKQVWPVLGRPGVVAVDGDPIGVWRPASSKDRLTLRVELWGGLPTGRAGTRITGEIEAQGERIAAARSQRLTKVDIDV